MPECSYCEASYDDEDEYLAHLADDHDGELSAIDRRRVANSEDDDGRALGPIVLVGVLGLGLAIVVYVSFFFGESAQAAPVEPGPVRSAHEHGTINVTIDGETLDFSQPRYQVDQTGARKFHFERGTDIWHKHATDVTVAYALSTLGIDVTERSVTFEGTTYRESDPGTEILIEVNGEPVDPDRHVIEGVQGTENLERADHVRVVVRTNGS